ncbi:hypothetical protein N7319_11765 [Aeromonas dhakensis]|uniref:GTP pyrophosphokinase n=1 Tax=Aeromonas dhakensis TaxID=196024 RepID=UPI0024493233|nr:hypothetical protein [Aeromonas dhakensis]MDH0175882.1 hypothetical protein [Aeromonas dhakensis]
MKEHSEWAENILPNHHRLTDSAVTILDSLVRKSGMDVLSISGRTKTLDGILEKIKRKNYKNPDKDMTDISGIRVIVYLESDISTVSRIIESAFNVDEKNSLNQDERLLVNQTGYRSVHYVCDLGKKRVTLPEFSDLVGLKFEVQVRTVLQHAWAELAHDRNYKFSEKLPPSIERSLYLYAGMLEIADRGFSELSQKIDEYVKNIHSKTAQGNLNYTLDSLSLKEFVDNWAKTNQLEIESGYSKSISSDLLFELEQFGIRTAQQLHDIIPPDYASICTSSNYIQSIFGIVRDWMLIYDWRRFIKDVDFNWVMSTEHVFDKYFDEEEMEEFISSFDWE